MRVFVHCGFHKTGTTSFQELLRGNRDRAPAGTLLLTPKGGVRPELKNAVRLYHQVPVRPLLGRVARQLRIQRDDAVKRGATTVLISMEVLAGSVPAGGRGQRLYPTARPVMERIGEVFGGDSLTFIFSTREPAGWVRSVHAHRLHTRGTGGPFEEFSAIPKFGRIDWDAEIAEIMDGVRGGVVVTRLEETAGSRLGACSDVLPLVMPERADFSDWVPGDRRNAGISAEAQEYGQRPFMRLVPRFIRSRLVRRFEKRRRAGSTQPG